MVLSVVLEWVAAVVEVAVDGSSKIQISVQDREKSDLRLFSFFVRHSSKEERIVPIYEYRCKKCGKQVEILMRSSDDILSCPNCGSSSMEKLISAPWVNTRGSSPSGGLTCCGRDERCEIPPCSTNGSCRRD